MLSISSNPTLAHGFAFRYDLPLPLNLYLGAAAATVVLSFVILVCTYRSTVHSNSRILPLKTWNPKLSVLRALRVLLGCFSIGVLTLLVSAGLWGDQSPLKNITPVTVWVIWWVGFVYFTALIGNLWPLINPWNAIGWGIERFTKRKMGILTFPSSLDCWPALVLFLTFAWLELIWSGGEKPKLLAIIILSYSLFCLAGMLVYGRDSWRQKIEIFSIIFNIFGRFAPINMCFRNGELHLRRYGEGLFSRKPLSFSMMIFVLTLLATVSFDGFMETPTWSTINHLIFSTSELSFILLPLNKIFGDLEPVIETVGLLIFPSFFTLIYLITCSITSWFYQRSNIVADHTKSPFILARWLVLSLVPIAVAYHIAHYLSYFLIAGQLFIALISDPFGIGWNLFNTANRKINIGIINAKAVWHISIFVIVVGHVIAVYLSHRILVRLFPKQRNAWLPHIPMTTLMAIYTSLSLWILAQPIVTN